MVCQKNSPVMAWGGLSYMSCVNLSKRCWIVKKMSNVKIWTMEVHKKYNKLTWGLHIMMSILMSNMTVTKIVQEHSWTDSHLWLNEKISIGWCYRPINHTFSEMCPVAALVNFFSFWHYIPLENHWIEYSYQFWPPNPCMRLAAAHWKKNIHGLDLREDNKSQKFSKSAFW